MGSTHVPGYRLVYRAGDTRYQICVANSEGVKRGVKRVTLDGEVLSEKAILLIGGGREHEAHVLMGERRAPAIALTVPAGSTLLGGAASIPPVAIEEGRMNRNQIIPTDPTDIRDAWSIEGDALLQSALGWMECPTLLRQALISDISWQAGNQSSVRSVLAAPHVGGRTAGAGHHRYRGRQTGAGTSPPGGAASKEDERREKEW
jgi:hypothetical protein